MTCEVIKFLLLYFQVFDLARIFDLVLFCSTYNLNNNTFSSHFGCPLLVRVFIFIIKTLVTIPDLDVGDSAPCTYSLVSIERVYT